MSIFKVFLQKEYKENQWKENMLETIDILSLS